MLENTIILVGVIGKFPKNTKKVWRFKTNLQAAQVILLNDLYFKRDTIYGQWLLMINYKSSLSTERTLSRYWDLVWDQDLWVQKTEPCKNRFELISDDL